MYVNIVDYCSYDANQSNIRYSDVKQSVSKECTIEDTIKCNPSEDSEPEYEAVKVDHKPACDIKIDANPAYHCGAELNVNPAYQATS